MCGIIGVARNGGLTENDRRLMRQMADGIHHRGPDGEGFFVDQRVAIGMRRLSIIDVEGGRQPLANEDRTVFVVANGEIYNFVELRKELEGRGHRFRGGSDCETIVHLYEELGKDCVGRLRGMFAFALIDLTRNLLILARDRVGEKPLLLAETNDHIVFSSELTPLVAAGVVPFELDADAVRMYYHWGFVPEPATPIRGVRKLPAGCILALDLVSGQRQEERYWSMDDEPAADGEPVACIREELDQIARIVFRSDVPIAIGLSAGIDSSAILSMAKRHASQPIAAFSIGYEGSTWQDESFLAEAYARQLGVDFHRVVVREDDVIRNFPEMCGVRDEPIANLTGVSIYMLMKAVRSEGFPVFLSGLGGDELFWGYEWHRRATRASLRKDRLWKGAAGFADYLDVRMPPVSATGAINWLEDLGGLKSGMRQFERDRTSSRDSLVFWDTRREYQLAERLLGTIAGPALRDSVAEPSAPFTGPEYWRDIKASMVERLFATYLRSDGLGQTDRLSMACSVESRTPLVDHRLIELVGALRRRHDDFPLGHKAWLRAAFRAYVPESILARRKRGFTPPWRRWNRRLAASFGPQLLGGVLVSQGLLRNDSIRSLVNVFDWARRPAPLTVESVILEQWARAVARKAGSLRVNDSIAPLPFGESGR